MAAVELSVIDAEVLSEASDWGRDGLLANRNTQIS
jgi:hypothetical protein